MAHDGNTRRDMAPRPVEPASTRRTPKKAASAAPGRAKPLFPVGGGGAKPAAPNKVPIPLNAAKPLPKFNAVVQAGASDKPDKAVFAVPAAAPAPAANAAATNSATNTGAFSGPPNIPLPNAKTDRQAASAKPAK